MSFASPIRKFLPFMQAAEKKGIKVFKINRRRSGFGSRQRSFLKLSASIDGKILGYAPSPGITAAHGSLAKIL